MIIKDGGIVLCYMDLGCSIKFLINILKVILKNKKAIIIIKIAQINDLIIFKIENDCIGTTRVRLRDGTFSTTKEMKKMHGIELH